MGILKKNFIKSIFSISAFSVFASIISFFQLAITARLISPTDFGIFAFSAIIRGVFSSFLMGVPLGIIKTENPTKAQIRDIQNISHLVALTFSIILLAIGAVLEIYFDRAGFFSVLGIQSLCLFFISFKIVHVTYIRKELNIEKIAVAQSASVLIGFFVVIYAAMSGFGVWALVIHALCVSLLEVIFVRLQSSLVISKESKIKNSLSIIRFGLLRGVDQSIVNMTQKLDQYFIGSMLGNASLGLYSVSSNLARRPFDYINPIFGHVLFPVYARIKTDVEKMQVYWSNNMIFFAFSFLSLAAFFALFSDLITNIVLGDKWIGANSIFALVCFGFAFDVMGYPIRTVAQTLGLNRRLISYSIASGFVILFAVIIATLFTNGLVPIAMSIVISKLFMYIFSFYFFFRKTIMYPYGVLKKIFFCTIVPVIACMLLNVYVFNDSLSVKIFSLLSLVSISFILNFNSFKKIKSLLEL